MSWLYKDKWAERVTNEEILIVRNEIKELLNKNNLWLFSWNKLNIDFTGTKNFLLPNNLTDKEDNWDVDIIYYAVDDKEIKSILDFLYSHNQVIEKFKNDLILSFLFQSKKINKKVQIDLHLLDSRNQSLVYNYFYFLKVPYLYFCIGMFLSVIVKNQKLIDIENYKIALSTKKWVILYYNSKYINLTYTIRKFCENVFWVDINKFDELNSYKKIAEYLVKLWFDKSIIEKNYNLWNMAEEEESVMNKSFRRHIDDNDKFKKILSMLNVDWFNQTKFEKQIIDNVNKYYPFIKQWIESLKKEIEDNKKQKEILTKKLEELFWKPLNKVDNNIKKYIPSIKNIIDELLIIKELSKKIKNINPKYEIYMVGGSVRDLIYNLEVDDFDLTWNIPSTVFHELFWGGLTEKYWTIFFKYKELEMEYTPYRIEKEYDWRDIWKITFTSNIQDDVKRRDFTINALYLSVVDWFEIVDLVWWLEDLNNKIIKAVWNPKDRFEEDYLRILRWIRLASKFDFTIEENTYKYMVEYYNDMIWRMSKERIFQEFNKWFYLNDQNYIKYMDKYFKDAKTNVTFYDNYINSLKDILYMIYLTYIQIYPKEAFWEKLQKNNKELQEYVYNFYRSLSFFDIRRFRELEKWISISQNFYKEKDKYENLKTIKWLYYFFIKNVTQKTLTDKKSLKYMFKFFLIDSFRKNRISYQDFYDIKNKFKEYLEIWLPIIEWDVKRILIDNYWLEFVLKEMVYKNINTIDFFWKEYSDWKIILNIN